MAPHAVLGMSAPPEVVVNTATDPDRRGAWLPGDWHAEAQPDGDDDFSVRLTAPGEQGGTGLLRVRAGDSGGSSVELRVDDPPAGLGAPQQILHNLEREVVDNFNAG